MCFFQEKAGLHNEKLLAETKATIEREVFELFNNPSSLNNVEFMAFVAMKKQHALQEVNSSFFENIFFQTIIFFSHFTQFDHRKMEDGNSNDIRDRLVTELNSMETVLNNVLLSYNECLQFYTDALQISTDEVTAFKKPTELVNLHHKAKDESVKKV